MENLLALADDDALALKALARKALVDGGDLHIVNCHTALLHKAARLAAGRAPVICEVPFPSLEISWEGIFAVRRTPAEDKIAFPSRGSLNAEVWPPYMPGDFVCPILCRCTSPLAFFTGICYTICS